MPFKMPIIGTSDSFTWEPSERDRRRALVNHGGQSLERLRERGGVDWFELSWILSDEKIIVSNTPLGDDADARRTCESIVTARAQHPALSSRQSQRSSSEDAA